MALQNLNNDCLYLIYDEVSLPILIGLTSKNNYQLLTYIRYKNKIRYLWKIDPNDPLNVEQILNDNKNMMKYLGDSIFNNPSMLQMINHLGLGSITSASDLVSKWLVDNYLNDLKYDLLIAFAITACFGILLILIN